MFKNPIPTQFRQLALLEMACRGCSGGGERRCRALSGEWRMTAGFECFRSKSSRFKSSEGCVMSGRTYSTTLSLMKNMEDHALSQSRASS